MGSAFLFQLGDGQDAELKDVITRRGDKNHIAYLLVEQRPRVVADRRVLGDVVVADVALGHQDAGEGE